MIGFILEQFKTKEMRVQINPQQNRFKSSSIIGKKISPQHKFSTSKQSNRYIVIDDKISVNQTPVLNMLPINFCHSPSQYNKLLITYGSKGFTNNEKNIKIPTVQFVNNDIHKRNKQKQDIIKQIYFTKLQQKQKQITVKVDECNCCCCDNYCQLCSDQMHFNFDSRPMLSSFHIQNSLNKAKSLKSLKSPMKRVNQPQPPKQQWINKSQLARTLKANKRKNNIVYQTQQFEPYYRTNPLTQRFIDKNKRLQYHKSVANYANVGQNKLNRIRQYDDERKKLSSSSLNKKQFKPEYPWNYHLPKQSVNVDKYCHKHHNVEGFQYFTNKRKEQQDNYTPRHQISHLSTTDIETHRKINGQIAYSKLKQQRQQKIQQKIKVTQNLRKLEQQRKQIIQNTPKQVFNPKEQFSYPI